MEAGVVSLYHLAGWYHSDLTGMPGGGSLFSSETAVLYGQGTDIGYHYDKVNIVTDYSIVTSFDDGIARNSVERVWGPFLERVKTPGNMQAIIKDDLLGSPIGLIHTTKRVEEGMWNDYDNDIRNSEYNFKRDFYINNPESAHFGELTEPTKGLCLRNLYPYFQKFTHPHGHPQGYDRGGKIYNDW